MADEPTNNRCELPLPAHEAYYYTADQMRAYGKACADAAAERERAAFAIHAINLARNAVDAATERAAKIAHNKALHCEEHDNPYGQGAALDIEDAIRG